MREAGVATNYLPEIVEACDQRPIQTGIGQIEQRTILSILPKVIDTARNVIALLPDTVPVYAGCAEERVEDSRSAIICGWDQGTANACATIAGVTFNSRQVGLEGHAAVVGIKAIACFGAGEADRCWMEHGVSIGPRILVRDSVEASVCAEAARDLYEQGLAGSVAAGIIGVGWLQVRTLALVANAGAVGGIDVVAIIEMADLVGERDVVGVGRPRYTRLLRRGAVHRMEVVRNIVAACPGGIKLNLTKAVGRAGGH